MPSDNVKASAITSVGFDYQTLHGLQLLCEWLDAPDRYQRMRFECTDKEVAPQSLDDIVAERSDGRFDYWQVKYTPNSANNPFTWEWLLHVEGKTTRARSNLKKWFDALQKIDESKLGNAQLVTNRIPERDIESCLAGGNRLDISKASEALQCRVEGVLGCRANAEWLFSRLNIVHSDKSYLNLSNSVISDLLRHTDSAGVDRLKNRARDWSFFEQEPHPDGWITLDILRSVISQVRPHPIPEDFTIPEGYQVPDEAFHEAFSAELRTRTQQIFVLSGPPGRGKSTYLSYLCESLQRNGIPIVRHHYFLSLSDRTVDRFSSYVVRDSILGQIERFHSRTGAKTGVDAELHEALATCAEYYKKQQIPFVVVIDGLDHVWRENAKDKRPLDEIFTQLIPVSDNLVLLVGTQPVADGQLPDRLLTHVPRSTWKILPPMSAMSVMNYMQAQIRSGRLPMQHEGRGEEVLADSAYELHRITGGHPLHVIYATEHLINSGDGLSKWNVEQIPGDLSQDARTYYESLWLKLTFVQRDALIILAEFQFFWPAEAFSSRVMLTGNDGNLNLREVEHLLHSTAAGLQPFHESLVVFVKTTVDFAERVPVLAPRVEKWLEAEAPDRLRNTWLWSVQARLGTPDKLIQGITRDWVIDRLREGYLVDMPIDLLAEAEVLAFDQKRYADAYRLRHLKTRLFNGPDFQISSATRLKVCSWKCADDGAVLDEVFASRHQLSVVDLAGLGLALRWHGLNQGATECGKDALRRHRGDSRFAVERHDSDHLEEVLYIGKAFAQLSTIDIENVNPQGTLNCGDIRLTAAFVTGLTANQDLKQIMALREKLESPSRKKLAEDAAIRVAALAGAQIHSWAEFRALRHSSIAGCWAQLVDDPHDTLPFSALPGRGRDFLDKEPLARLTHEWFFKTVLLSLSTRWEFSWVPYPDSNGNYFPEVVTYLNRMTLYAEDIAKKWRNRIPAGFGELFDLFADLEPPGKYDYNKRYPHSEFCKTLIQVALDCQILGAALGAPVLVDVESLKTAARTPWFNLRHFRASYAKTGIRLITDDAARYLISDGRAYLCQWAETCEYAEAVLEMCEVALLHKMDEEARQLCRLCWDYVLGYGHRKDSTIITLLEAVEYLANDDPAFSLAALKEVAPQVHHITDYTDGKGTRHAHSYANELLAKLESQSLAAKYEGHISSGDWHFADESFASFFTGDISSEVLEALARTGLPQEAFNELRKRSEQGEETATKLLCIAASHNGVAYGSVDKTANKGGNHDLREFEGGPEAYPPDKIDSLLSAIDESKTFSTSSYLPRWYDFWAAQGRESDLLRALEPHLFSEDSRRDDCRYILDQTFESSVKLNGKDKAFRYAVRAQKEMGGWSDFYESLEKSKQRLQRVAELYPERADEFIAESCFSWLRHKRQPSSRVIPDDKLVFFLVQLGRIAEASNLVQAMVRSVQEDTRNLQLSKPSWGYTAPEYKVSASAEVQFLIARSRWPVPAVKWWALQELADLLLKPQNEQLEAELYYALLHSKLETEVVELLFVFWMAAQGGYVPNPILTTHIDARSPASSMVLRDLFCPLLHEGRLRSPLILSPATFQGSADFEEAQGTTVPLIFMSLLKDLQQTQLPSFVKQYAFEWENSASLYSEAPLQGNIGYFYQHPRDEMTGQFVIRASHRGRSAYLRTLAVAEEIFGAPENLINFHAQAALPLDPTLAFIRPSQPDWLPMWDPKERAEPASIGEFINQIAQNLRDAEAEMVPMAIMMPLYISEKRIIELEVVRWVQWEVRPVIPEELSARFEQCTSGWCFAEDLQTITRCPIQSLERILDSETCAAPTASRFYTWRRGYLHSDLESRGIYYPISTVKDAQVLVKPRDGQLDLMVASSTLGQWRYWNAGWAPFHPRLVRSFCGTALTANSAAVPLLWETPPVRQFLLWRCTTVKRDESYSSYSPQFIYGAVMEDPNH